MGPQIISSANTPSIPIHLLFAGNVVTRQFMAPGDWQLNKPIHSKSRGKSMFFKS